MRRRREREQNDPSKHTIKIGLFLGDDCIKEGMSTDSYTPSSTAVAVAPFAFSFSDPGGGASASAAILSQLTPFQFDQTTTTTTTTSSTTTTGTSSNDTIVNNTPFTFDSSFTLGFTTGADMNERPAREPASVRLAAEQAAAAAAAAASTSATMTPSKETQTFSTLTFTSPLSFPSIEPSSSNPFYQPSSNDFEKKKPPSNSSKSSSSSSTSSSTAATTASSTVVGGVTKSNPTFQAPPPVPVDLSKQYAVILNLEQKILDLVSQACRTTFEDPEYNETLQTIKHHFYHREFEKVFNEESHLPVYVAQYLPMRALCYAHLWSTQPLLAKLLEKDIVIYCIGAGPGSEAVGITMAREQIIRQRIRDGKLTLEQSIQHSVPPKFRIHTQDMFDWESSFTSVLSSLAIHAPLAYRSTNMTISKGDIMDPSLKTAAFKNSHVLTMMFVINELFQENKSGTMAFLERLITAMRPGAFLIVADSAGDFSQLEIGATTKNGKKKETTETTETTTPNETGGASDAMSGPQLEDDDDAAGDDGADGADDEESSPPTAGAGAAAGGSTPSASSTGVPRSGGPRVSSGVAPKARRKYWVYSLLDAIPSLTITYAVDSLWYRYPEKEKNLKYPLKFENMRYFLRIYQKRA